MVMKTTGSKARFSGSASSKASCKARARAALSPSGKVPEALALALAKPKERLEVQRAMDQKEKSNPKFKEAASKVAAFLSKRRAAEELDPITGSGGPAAAEGKGKSSAVSEKSLAI